MCTFNYIYLDLIKMFLFFGLCQILYYCNLEQADAGRSFRIDSPISYLILNWLKLNKSQRDKKRN